MPRTHKTKKILYMDELFRQEDLYFKRITKATEAEAVERMQISPHEGQILQFLVHLSKAQKVVEIGTLYAYSTLHIAKALPEKGQIFTLDISSERHKKSQEILKDSPDFQKIHWLSGKALETLKSIENQGPFDMLFIDADKEAYLEYLSWGEKNLKSGGLLVADNTFLFGAVYGEARRDIKKETLENMIQFNKRLSGSSCWEAALIPTAEGLSLGVKQ